MVFLSKNALCMSYNRFYNYRKRVSELSKSIRVNLT